MCDCGLKVGVVVPMFGVSVFLRECLDSVLNQSYGNLCVLLVSDGDLVCLDIALEYAALDSRFIVIDKENGGQATGRNVGIEFFSGGYEFIESNLLDSKTSNFIESNFIESKNIESNNLYCYKVLDSKTYIYIYATLTAIFHLWSKL